MTVKESATCLETEQTRFVHGRDAMAQLIGTLDLGWAPRTRMAGKGRESATAR
jgi:hypothetical protein